MLRTWLLRLIMGSREDFSVRPAAASELSAVAELLRTADLPTEGVAEGFGDGYAVAGIGERVIGAAGVEVHGDCGLLRSVVVAPEWRGHGVGEAVTRDRIRWASERGLRQLILLTTTAGSYFPRLGFRRITRSEVPESVRSSSEFASVCPASAAVLSLDLEEA